MVKSLPICRPKLYIKIVNWFKPNFNFLKLYVDGFSKGNTSTAGGDGILRDHMGYVLMSYPEFYGQSSNNYAKGIAILLGIQWCHWNNLNQVIVESDSMLTIQMIMEEIHISWQKTWSLFFLLKNTDVTFHSISKVQGESNSSTP